MGKTCLSKPSTSFRANCGIPLHGVQEAVLTYGSDISTFDVVDGKVTEASLVSGAFSYLVENVKNSIHATQSLSGTDYNNSVRQSVSFYIYDKDAAPDLMRAVLSGQFLCFLKMRESGVYKVFGTYANLEVSAVEEDSNANGAFVNVTLATPEGSVGDQYITTSASIYESLKAKAK